jgi:hypothetical protein
MDRKSIIALILIGLFSLPVAAQAPAPGGAAPAGTPATANPNVQTNPGIANLLLVTIEDFEEAEDWVARATSPLGETKSSKMVQRGDIRAADDENTRPPDGEAYSAINNPENPNHILGVKTWFEHRGYDRVEIKAPHEYVIRGKARQFSVWVLGRKFRHNISMKVRDYRGKLHILDLGRLDFFGWRKLSVTVPGWLPQSTRYSLLDKNLHFVSLFVTSDTHEVPGTFYFYVDGLKALVDRSELNYPGSEIKDNW